MIQRTVERVRASATLEIEYKILLFSVLVQYLSIQSGP